MSALSLLQSDPPEMLEQAVGDARMSLGDLLRRKSSRVRAGSGMGGDDLNLSAVQEDAVDLVGMLFDVLLDERDFEPDVRRKIGRMLVPYVKVAVKDRRMFVYKGHPARRFLNAVDRSLRRQPRRCAAGTANCSTTSMRRSIGWSPNSTRTSRSSKRWSRNCARS